MDTKKHILLIVNPVSGTTDKSGIIAATKNRCDDEDYNITLYETTGKGDKKAINELLDSKDVFRVLIAGGDGTIKMVAEVLEDFSIPVGILPAGSANGLALNLKIPENLQQQIDVALGNNTIEIDILKINGHSCIHIEYLGINAELIKNYEKTDVRGKFGYLLQSVPTILKCEYPFNFEISFKNGKKQKSGVLLAIANANNYGTGATINPKGKMNDGNFEILIFKNLDFFEILKTIYDEADLSSDFAECISTSNAVITSKEPVSFQIDGEFISETKKIEVSVSQKKLEVAVPYSFLLT